MFAGPFLLAAVTPSAAPSILKLALILLGSAVGLMVAAVIFGAFLQALATIDDRDRHATPPRQPKWSLYDIPV